MKKLILSVLLFGLLMSLAGCGSKEEDEIYYETTVSFGKEGQVKEVIVESFDKPYYTEDGLRAFFQEKISEYNSTYIGSGTVSLDKIAIEEGRAVATLIYDSDETYKNFNGTSLFYGTVNEAYDEGYITETVLKEYGASNTITKNDLMGMQDATIIVVGEVVRVDCPKKIAYTSANVEVVDDKTARVSSDSTGLAYIVVK